MSQHYVLEAQAKRFEAQKESLPSKRMKLLCEASGLFLRACDNVDDPVFQKALAILANDALTEANQLKTMMSRSPPNKESTEAQELNKRNEDFEWTIQANRIVAAIHTKRVQGLSEIPQAVKPTLSERAKDLLQMETQLDNLGFRRNNKRNESLSLLNQSQQRPNTGLQESSLRTYSALGESFMLLNDDFKNDVPSSDRNNSLSSMVMRSESTKTTMPIRSNTVNISSTPSTVTTVTSLLNENSLNSIAQIVPYLTSLVSQPQTSVATEQKKDSIPNDNIEWNEQSLFLPRKATDQKHNSEDTELSSTASSEGIKRLLVTIATLRDENIRLEQENQQISIKMEKFHREYTKKFSELRRDLEEYREAYPPEKNPFKLPDEKSISEKDLLYDLEALKKRLDEANDRRSQLEQALSGVLEKYYSAKDELRKKSEVLDKLLELSQRASSSPDQIFEQLVHELVQYSRKRHGRDKERMADSGTSSGGGGGSQSNKSNGVASGKVDGKDQPSSSMGRSNVSSRHGSIQTVDGFVGGKPPAIPRPDLLGSSVESSHMSGLSSPNALYARKQLLQSNTRNKHSSTTTLESLQKSGKLGPKM